MGTNTQIVQQTTEQKLPAWLQSYYADLFGRAQGAAGDAYTPYGEPRLEGLTPDQLAAYQSVRDIQGGYQPSLDTAGQYFTDAGIGSAHAAADPAMWAAWNIKPQDAISPYMGDINFTGQAWAVKFMSPM